jgi:integrase
MLSRPYLAMHLIRTVGTLPPTGLRAGVPIKVVQERLGHATTAITQDIYSHVLPGMDAEAARTVAAMIEAS